MRGVTSLVFIADDRNDPFVPYAPSAIRVDQSGKGNSMLGSAVRRTTTGVVALSAVLLVSTAPAQATPQGQISLGSANVTQDGVQTSIQPIAPCDMNGNSAGSSSGDGIDGVVSYGGGTTSCTKDASAQTSTMKAQGNQFESNVLSAYGGPDIRLDNYSVTCSATKSGTNVNFTLGNLRGISVPSTVPTNFTLTFGPTTKPQAKVILNEATFAQPSDGSVTFNMMHIVLPEGGQVSGDIYVGQAACSPVKS